MTETILITGSQGQVGWELERSLSTLGKIVACDRYAFDLSNPKQMIKVIREMRPSIIVNAAAYTAVDNAELEPSLAMQVNGEAPGILAEEAKRLNAILVHFSTDYVFDGTSTIPYTETDIPNPINSYGKSKYTGEINVQAVGGDYLIFRTSWVYGNRRKNFLSTMLKLFKEQDEIKIVADQIGAPTWCRLIAEATAQILARYVKNKEESETLWGIYHLSSKGKTSWYGFAESIALWHAQQLYGKLTPISSNEYLREHLSTAKRPENSVLSNEKLHQTFGICMPEWEYGLELCLRP